MRSSERLDKRKKGMANHKLAQMKSNSREVKDLERKLSLNRYE
jgi:hypothetical protein